MNRFDYFRASDTADAVRKAASGSRGAGQFLGGGTTLIDLMRLNVMSAERVVDLTAITGLESVLVQSDGSLVIGGLARMSDVAEHRAVVERFPALSESLWKAASQQVRNMATVAGNLMQRTRCAYFRSDEFPCNKRMPGSGCSAMEGANRSHAVLGGSDSCIAVYPGDWAVALVAFDASIEVRGQRGSRRLRLADLHRLPGTTPQRETNLAAGEMITHIHVPAGIDGRGSTYHKVRDRDSYAFALASAAVAVEVTGGVVRQARIAVGGVATKPWRDLQAEALLVGQALTKPVARRAAEQVFAAGSTKAHNAYKIPLGIETVIAALMIAQERAQA
jgi:xanthine dehydrogenase YagS FAD-binding subunit